jgi:1-acyl-sn-glycerol-3-phosphate acyltransferase
MQIENPLLISQQLLNVLGTRVFIYHQDRVPQDGAILIVSNHRSFMDPPVLMAAINCSIRFACHHYMGQIPVLKDVVARLGCFPLDVPEQRQHVFFHQAVQLLQARQVVGLFPEGAKPMVESTCPQEMRTFQRGFAHLALRAPMRDLAILPVAIASEEESINSLFPLRLLHLIDPSEPLFNQSGWHPMVIYHRVNILVGQPLWITDAHRQAYAGKQARSIVSDLSDQCYQEIAALLKQGC